MISFNMYFPVEIMFGAGKIEQMPAICKKFGSKVFAVFDPFLKGSDLASQILKGLKKIGLGYYEFYDVVPNPRHTVIDQGAALCVKQKCDLVMAIGGGSAIDTGKAIALVSTHGGSCWDYTVRHGEKFLKPETPCLPIITAPTTAGTGTEATHISVINNAELKLKAAIINPIIYPKVSIVDPELMISVPKHIAALTGIDTFAHAFESFIANGANEWSRMLALKSMQLFSESFVASVNDSTNITAKSKMALSCTLAGYAFTQSGLCLPHAIGQPVSALTDGPHGGTLAACIPQVIEFTLPHAEADFAVVAQILDPRLNINLPASQKAQKLPDIIKSLYKQTGVTVTYKDYGLREVDIPTVVDLCFSNYLQDAKGHPRAVTKEDVFRIVKRCL